MGFSTKRQIWLDVYCPVIYIFFIIIFLNSISGERHEQAMLQSHLQQEARLHDGCSRKHGS